MRCVGLPCASFFRRFAKLFVSQCPRRRIATDNSNRKQLAVVIQKSVFSSRFQHGYMITLEVGEILDLKDRWGYSFVFEPSLLLFVFSETSPNR